jgi:hypothetical protein
MNWEKSSLKNCEIYHSFGSLGTKYWQIFWRRKRDEWCRLDSFQDMYGDMYIKLWEAGIAEK